MFAKWKSWLWLNEKTGPHQETGGNGLRPVWQHRPYDHILRPDESREAVAYYIWMNPVRKGLCTRPEEWPFSGSLTVDWKRLLTPPENLWVPPWKREMRRGADLKVGATSGQRQEEKRGGAL
jgi:hypothetical protein